MMSKKVVIATHDGVFHSDDVFAVATLLSLLDVTPATTTVVRTRDETLIRKADFVVDVGGLYDSDKNRFDHHQIGGAGKRENIIPYAAFGLVWQKFGTQISGSKAVALIVDSNLVSPIDAGDSGVDIYKKTFAGVAPYCVDDYIHNLRPTWQEGVDALDARFLEAVAFARKVLEREIACAKAAAAAEVFVREAYEKAADKSLIVLDAFYPHGEILSGFSEPLFTVSPRPDGKWQVKAVRDDVSSFKNRKDFPESWAGKRENELAVLTGVSDAVFCHSGRFMAVARTREGAIELARQALSL